MRSVRSFIRGLLRRDIRISAATVRPGDIVVASLPSIPASVDVADILNTLQDQFPGSPIHLLVGFGTIQMVSKEHSGNSDSAADEGRDQPSKARQHVDRLVDIAPQLAEQGNVLLLRKCLGDRVIALSIPVAPNQKGNSVDELHLNPSAIASNIDDIRVAQLNLLAEDILRDTKPGLFHSDDGPRLRRLLARKMRAAVIRFLANHKEASHA